MFFVFFLYFLLVLSFKVISPRIISSTATGKLQLSFETHSLKRFFLYFNYIIILVFKYIKFV